MAKHFKVTLGFAFITIYFNVLMLLTVSFLNQFVIFIKLIPIYLKPTSGFFEASLTDTSMIYKNDTSFMNSNGLRIKKVNRTYVMTGWL